MDAHAPSLTLTLTFTTEATGESVNNKCCVIVMLIKPSIRQQEILWRVRCDIFFVKIMRQQEQEFLGETSARGWSADSCLCARLIAIERGQMAGTILALV